MTSAVRIEQKNIDSGRVSLPKDLIYAYIKGMVHEVLLLSKENGSLIEKYDGDDLDKLIGSAVANGKRYTQTIGHFYYLGDRK